MDEERIEAIIDPEILQENNLLEIEHILRIAVLCMQVDSTERPTMSDCLSMLEGNGLSEKWDRWRSCNILANQLAIGIPSSMRKMQKWAIDSDVGFDRFSVTGR
jgi:hypothetical protein